MIEDLPPRFASLGSGSSGNATLVAAGDQAILIDCGFSVKELKRRLQRLGFPLEGIIAVLCTHEHGDHAKGVGTLARREGIPTYMSRGTMLAAGFDVIESIQVLSADSEINIGPFSVRAVTVPHDAREPLQFVVSVSGKKIGVLTDLGCVTELVVDAYSACDALLIEANHDKELLAIGPYPYALQQRVGSDWGHLNNEQTRDLLTRLDLNLVQHLVVGHISQKNNCMDLVREVLADQIDALPSVTLANQDEGFAWLQLR